MALFFLWNVKALPPCSVLFLNNRHRQPCQVWGCMLQLGLKISVLEVIAALKEMPSVFVGFFSPLCWITEWNRKLLSLQISQRTAEQPYAFPPVCWLLRSIRNGAGQLPWAGAKMVLWWSHLAKAVGSVPSLVTGSMWSYLHRSKLCLLPLSRAHSCECACLACKLCWN